MNTKKVIFKRINVIIFGTIYRRAKKYAYVLSNGGGKYRVPWSMLKSEPRENSEEIGMYAPMTEYHLQIPDKLFYIEE